MSAFGGKADLAQVTARCPVLTHGVIQGRHSTCLSAFVTDRAMKAWYYAFAA